MAALLIIGVTNKTIDRFVQNSLLEAQNLKDFLEESGDYERIGVYHVERTWGTFSKLRQLEEVGR